MSSTGFGRFVALGDSFTEGVGDVHAGSPNGVRGWADRVAVELAQTSPGLQYANLAVRGKLLDQVRHEQVAPALSLHPDLVTISAGGNDILRPSLDLDRLIANYDDIIGKLTADGARVLVFTTFDGSFDALYKRLRGRAATYNEYVREIADRHGAVIVDFWRMKGFDDRRMWSWDRLHLSDIGHQRMAAEVLDVLGVAHTIARPELPEPPARTKAERRREDLVWTREFLLPWVGRRIARKSSGDDIAPKYPQLVDASTLEAGDEVAAAS